MRWNVISFKTEEKFADLVSNSLIEAGASGAEIKGGSVERQKYEELNADLKSTDEVTVKAYFGEDGFEDTLSAVKISIQKIVSTEGGCFEMSVSQIENTDWNENFKKNFRTFRAAGNIVVKPTWENYEQMEGDIVIEMDPGMAFGSGDHETTKMCLELIQKYITNGANVMDVGCGSGILAIACAKLGADKVLALDNDPVSVKTAKENALMNDTAIEIKKSDLLSEAVEGKYSLITANIVADIIIRLNTGIKKFMNPDSVYIISGIIESRMDDVLDSLRVNGLLAVETLSMGDWRAVATKLKGGGL